MFSCLGEDAHDRFRARGAHHTRSASFSASSDARLHPLVAENAHLVLDLYADIILRQKAHFCENGQLFSGHELGELDGGKDSVARGGIAG